VKRVAIAVGVVLALLALIALGLRFFVNANEFRPRIEAEASAAIGRKVTLGDLSFSLFSGSLKAQDCSIADDPRFSTEPFIVAKTLAIGVNVRQLITTRQLTITDLAIDDARIALIENSAGDWNFSSAISKRAGNSVKVTNAALDTTPGGTPLNLLISVMSIANSHLSITQPGPDQKPLVIENLNVDVKQFSPAGGFPFSLTGKLTPSGDIKLDGNVGRVNTADASLTPVQVNVKISGLDLATAAVGAPDGVSGVVAFDGSSSIEGDMVDAKGKLNIEHAKFVRQGSPAKQPIDLDFAVRHNLKTRAGVLSESAVHLGKGSVSISGTYAETGTLATTGRRTVPDGGGYDAFGQRQVITTLTQSNQMRINLHVAGSAIPLSAVMGTLPALGIQLPSGSSLEGGTASVNVTVTGPVADPALAGTVGLSNTKLKAFDLGSKLATIERLAGIRPSPDTAIQTLSANVRSGPGGTSIQNLKFIAPSIGELNGAGTISARRDLDFKMRVALPKQGAFQLALGNSVPFFVRGNISNPLIVPDMAGIAAAEARRPVEVITGLGGLLGRGKKK
jgi:AsmA protein